MARSRTQTWQWAAGLGLALAGGTTQAVELTQAVLARMPPGLSATFAKELAVRQATHRSTWQMGVDPNAPTLISFSAGKEVDLRKPNDQVVIDLGATDDWSGLDVITVTAQSPSGLQYASTATPTRWGTKAFNGKVALQLSPFAEAGAWTIHDVQVTDIAGNLAYVGQGTLAAMGNIRFLVKNDLRSDQAPPALVGAHIITTALSASGHARGTANHAPIVRAKLQVHERQDGRATSGVSSGYIVMCLQDGRHCLYLSGDVGSVLEERQGVVTVGAEVAPEETPGDYDIWAVGVVDQAGNETDYFGAQMGGDTDFGVYFPLTTVTLTP